WRKAMNRNALAILLTCAGTAVPALADTIYVAPCGDDTWTGASPVCAAPDGPKRTIQAAIDASADGGTVLIEDGTYTGPGNRDMDFGGRAITVLHAGEPSACVIDCEGSATDPHRAFTFNHGETAASVLDGLTAQGGAAPGDLGGAVLCQSSSPEIRNC